MRVAIAIERIVAYAAPETPNSKVKMKMGSRMILSPDPNIIAYIARFASPSALSMANATWLKKMKMSF